ncbi:RCC1/BLIP-II protein [Hesseltinella vesiculosa]|uniref:RCC1/BLIP-II protein n=1 Tax=Hesseltinella vesiculosa TaxID=101127 RepID=A0A1X2G802_9FUNG|nr:RCC1/BLIP-II protein [Hesseltinella vesiculosa]
MEDGAVYAFGRTDSSQLGLSAALIEERQTKGKHEDSQFKKAVGVPTEVPGLENVVALTSGSNHGLSAHEDGSCRAWGFGESYALGQGEDEDVPTPSAVTGQKLEGKTAFCVGAGAQHSALLADE